MANRYDRLDNTAPIETALKADSVSVGRSAFDWSCIHNTNGIIGSLIPIDCFDVVPNEDLDISIASLIEFRNPTTRQLFNGMRVFVHAYYNRLTDLWEGARNWLDNGRTGKLSLTRPNLVYTGFYKAPSNVTYRGNACTPMSLLDYLGLPAQRMQDTLKTSDGSVTASPLRSFQCAYWSSNNDFTASELSYAPDFFPADCCMAYQRNWRDFYCNKNLLQNNPYWFPENEEHFILSYSCSDAVCVNYGNENLSSVSANALNNIVGNIPTVIADYSVTPEPNNPITNANDYPGYIPTYAPNLSGLKFRQFRGDRFTTALPFPDLIRGDIPILEYTSDNVASVTFTRSDDDSVELDLHNNYSSTIGGTYVNTYLKDSTVENTDPFNVTATVDLSSLGITMSDIYTLETLTAFRRRMGMTNGDYNEMIKAQYGVNPHVHDRKGTYIGGYYQDFAFSSVTQSSETGSTPLGTKAGQGVSSGSGSIGHFHTPDFGWIQIYMSIVPDVYYTQGIPRMFSKKSNLEMYFPIFNNLPAQAILNKELYVSGDSDVDNDVFAYEDRYAEYKSRHNRVSGLMALPVDKAPYDTARVIARRFESVPSLNSLFVTMVPENVDMSPFSVTDEPPFDISVGINCRRVFPAPYTAIEGSLSSPALVRG
ncbi:major capsid protein [Alces alces faeces associated microvirus MP3 6497]|uniref:major capsid protein n=1 Tax=Alces alces faeces associated microvirus MP3 6497 TaxID=2219139 RepID=UPI000DF06D64|nr:major capsid protein [Alces alces faeces associated microvirus MP3 6497]AXB22558.1 major capsid protein [Alces alces faeces associated microvirus MP3 6497]